MAQSRNTTFAILLSLAPLAQAQELPELLEAVDEGKAQRLIDYNSTFLRHQTYYASRYRIVEVNSSLLSQAQEITVTPFEDVDPIHLLPLPGTPRRNGEAHIFWSGRYGNDPLHDVFGAGLSVTITAHAWDLEPSGDAVISSQKPAFYSVNSVFDVLGGSKYVLQALKYTPKYSVIYEIRRDTVIPVRTDIMPGDPPPSAEERAASERYKRFVETLPDERGKPIRGDVP